MVVLLTPSVLKGIRSRRKSTEIQQSGYAKDVDQRSKLETAEPIIVLKALFKNHNGP